MNVREQLEQLDKLRAAATPGEWKVRDWWPSAIESESASHIGVLESAADAEVVVAAVDALHSLTTALRAMLDVADILDANDCGTSATVIRAAIAGALDSP